MTKVLCRTIIQDKDEKNLDYLSMDRKVVWEDKSIHIPNDGNNIQQIEENQRISRIKIKNTTKEYQNGIIALTQDILDETNQNQIKRNIKV